LSSSRFNPSAAEAGAAFKLPDAFVLKAEVRQLKETLAEVLIENRLLKKKRSRRWGGRFMRYCASEKFEIIAKSLFV
jgi:hypothetical protein